MEQEQRHLHIAVLTQGTVRWELANYLLQLVHTRAGGRRQFSVAFYEGRTMAGRPVSSNRNRIVRDRPAGSDLIMIDADVIPHYDFFEIALQGKDIIVCPIPIWRADDANECPVRINLEAMAEQRIISLGANQYDEILNGGTGAIYISCEVLEHPDLKAPFQFVCGDDGVTVRGEDYNFCERARAAGFQVWTANRLLCGHAQEIDLLTVMRRFYNMMGLRAEEAE